MADQQQEMNVIYADSLDLPPGFRFHPSDVEIVNDYLMNKVRDTNFTCIAIGEADINKTEPWNLRDKAKCGDKEWYFFYQKDRKYPTGLRANRATAGGYWKATGKDKEIYKTIEGVVMLVGMKKTLVYYKGRAPRGDKTNWVMHEYRLEGSGRILSATSASSSAANNTTTMKSTTSSFKDEWVVCRVFEKTTGIKKTTTPAYQVTMASVEIDQNQNNISPIPVPMPLQLSLPVPMPTQFPILTDFGMDTVAPYCPNVGAGMQEMMPPMGSISGTGRLQINSAMFGNTIATPSQMNIYHQMGTRAAAGEMDMGVAADQMSMGTITGQMGMGEVVSQMGMGAASASNFDVAASESRSSSMVSQKDDHANAAEISMMSMGGPGSAMTTIEMESIWKYKY